MPRFSPSTIRNLALTGHTGAGKTTLFEALLLAGGTINSAGSVERGSTVSDYDPLEKERGHSLNCAIAAVDFAGTHINLIDTPGLPDFRGPTLSALAAVETCAIVVNAASGIQHQTVRMMEYAKARNLCRVLIVNRIDADGVNLEILTARSARTLWSVNVFRVNLPASGATAVVDCFFNPDRCRRFWRCRHGAHQTIIDQVVEINETVMEHYLEKGESDPVRNRTTRCL